MHRNEKKVIAVLFLVFLELMSRTSFANFNQSLSSMNNYPRVEVYSEVNKGDPNAGSNTWLDPNGRKVYGGAADYRPYIKLRTYTFDEQQKKELLALNLTFLPYFKEQKEKFTLAQYLEESQVPDKLRKRLPNSLDGLYSLSNDPYFDYLNTYLLYERRMFLSLVVVWLSPDVWYTDEVYYRADELDNLLEKVQPVEDFPMAGTFSDFLHLSPLLQRKLNEGFLELTPKKGKPVIPRDGEIFSYSLSPGMPNTNHYHMKLKADGTFEYGGKMGSGKTKIDFNRLTALLLQTLKLDWEHYEKKANSRPVPFANDRQTVSMSIWYNGRLYKLNEPEVSANYPLDYFVKFALDLFEPELQLKKNKDLLGY